MSLISGLLRVTSAFHSSHALYNFDLFIVYLGRDMLSYKANILYNRQSTHNEDSMCRITTRAGCVQLYMFSAGCSLK